MPVILSPDKSGLLRMTLINKKGGDAYGKVPKRIAFAFAPPLKVRGARGVVNPERGILKDSPKGKRTMPGPGINALPYPLALDGRGLR